MEASKITNGIIDNFFVFEIFDNSRGDLTKKYQKVLNRLIKSKLVISKANINKRVDFGEQFLMHIKEREKFKSKNKNSMNRSIKGDFIHPNSNDYTFSGFESEPYDHSEGTVIDLLWYSQNRAIQQFVHTNYLEELHTKTEILTTKNNFLLYPIRIIWEDETVSFIDLTITTYKHGYSILNATIRFSQAEINNLEREIWRLPIKEAYFPRLMFNNTGENEACYSYKKIGRCNNPISALNRYLDFIQKEVFNYESEKENFNCLTISNISNLPANFEKIETKLNENIFKLLFAPVGINLPSANSISERLEKSSMDLNEITRVYANQYRLIFLMAKDFKNRLEEMGILNKEYQQEHMYSAFRGGFIFAIEKLLLKMFTSKKFILKSLNENLSLKKLYQLSLNRNYELRYETDQIFYNYTTTRVLIDFLYKKCLDSYSESIFAEQQARTLQLINLNKERRVAQFSILGPIIAIIISIVLSMSGIKDLLETFGIFDPQIHILFYIIFNGIVIGVILLSYLDQVKRIITSPYNFIKYIYRKNKAKKNTIYLKKNSENK